MRKGAIAVIIIILIVGAGFAAFYLFQPTAHEPTEVELKFDQSDDYAIAIINEFMPNTDPTEEFIELYIHNEYESLEGFILTTYDGERIILPDFGVGQSNSYIQVFTGSGANDTDLSDGQATIHANLAESILDIAGDEIGLHDTNGSLVSFIRYNGGNGDETPTGWASADDAPVPTGDSSASFFWDAFPEGNWFESPATPGEPNIQSFMTTGAYGGLEVWITNGLRSDLEIDGISDGLYEGENITVTAGPGVNASVIDLVKEHINFSLNFYEELGFGTPMTDAANRVRVRVINGASNDSVGATSPDGSIVIEVGRNATKEELKIVGEHELMHTFHFKTYNDTDNDTYRHLWFTTRWFVEGHAEFFGMWSMLKNYPNMTMSSWMAMARRIGGLNWHDHYRDLNTDGSFGQWGGSWDNYMAVFLFTKWLNETYGVDKLLEIYNATRYYGAGDPKNISPEQAIQNVLGMSLAELLAKYWAWLLLKSHNANGVPTYTPNIHLNYTDSSVNDTARVQGGGGAVIEEVEMNGESPFTIHLNYTRPADTWIATVLIFYEDGTNESITVKFNSTTKMGQVRIDPQNPKKIARVWVVKGLLTNIDADITMRVVPDHEEVVNMTYSGDTLNDTVTLDPGESAYEVVYINSTQAFSVFLNWTGGNQTHLNFTIIRFWDDGSNDTFRVEYENETWRGYILDPDAGPTTVTKLIIIKENLNETSVDITMTVTPANETPSNSVDPIPFDFPWGLWDGPWDKYWDAWGGFLQGYFFLNSSEGYDFLSEVFGGDIFGYILDVNFTVVTEFTLTPSTPIFQLLNPDDGIYYLAFTAGTGDADNVEVKPYAWP